MVKRQDRRRRNPSEHSRTGFTVQRIERGTSCCGKVLQGHKGITKASKIFKVERNGRF